MGITRLCPDGGVKKKIQIQNPHAISGFPIYADLCENSIATQVNDVSSAFGDLMERFLRDLSPVLDYLPIYQSWIVYCPIFEEIPLQIDVSIAYF